MPVPQGSEVRDTEKKGEDRRSSGTCGPTNKAEIPCHRFSRQTLSHRARWRKSKAGAHCQPRVSTHTQENTHKRILRQVVRSWSYVVILFLKCTRFSGYKYSAKIPNELTDKHPEHSIQPIPTRVSQDPNPPT